MNDDTPGKGEARMEPVDVDVLGNLINAQAAYLEALSVAAEHLEIDPESAAVPFEELLSVMSRAQGGVLTAMALGRT